MLKGREKPSKGPLLQNGHLPTEDCSRTGRHPFLSFDRSSLSHHRNLRWPLDDNICIVSFCLAGSQRPTGCHRTCSRKDIAARQPDFLITDNHVKGYAICSLCSSILSNMKSTVSCERHVLHAARQSERERDEGK